jgi:SulP family sulfate permease
MTEILKRTRRSAGPTFAELFTPKLVTVLREGYRPTELGRDAFAGLSVAIVALPLSMAIAIGSGLGPERGLYAAIVGGFIVSLLGGSRFQIGGPAGAFIVLVSATVMRHGVEGMLLATLLAGLMMAAAGFLRIGTYIRLIPYPVTIGFTAGVALIILASQLRDLLGLTISGPPAHGFLSEIEAAARAIDTFNPAALAIGALVVATIFLIQRIRPNAPAILVAVVLAALAAALLGLDVETIGSRFGGVPSRLPAPAFPEASVSRAIAVLPDAFAFALLGAIESLLSATVADGMTGRRHRSNCELVAQGAANVAASVFGAMVVTGTIARTATNVRAGAHGPVSGLLHSAFLLVFMILAAPLAAYLPLAALAGVLIVAAWRMIEAPAIAALVRASTGDAVALAATLLLTVFRNLTEGIVAGAAIGALAFIQRMSERAGLASEEAIVAPDRADLPAEARTDYSPDDAGAGGVGVYRVRGALFFGSAASLGAALDRIVIGRRALVIDFSEASLVDSTGAQAIRAVADAARRRNARLFISGAAPEARRALHAVGVTAGTAEFHPDLDGARAAAAKAAMLAAP